jgi:hypothetical protein
MVEGRRRECHASELGPSFVSLAITSRSVEALTSYHV